MKGRRAAVRPQVYIGHATTATTDAEKTYRTFTTRQPLADSSSAQAWVSMVMDLDEASEFDETAEISDITALAEYTGVTSPQMRLVKMQEIIAQNEEMPLIQRIFNAVHQATVSVDTTGTGDSGWGSPLTSVAVASVSDDELLLVFTEGQCAYLLRGTQIERLTPEPSDLMLRSVFDLAPEPIQVATWTLQRGDIVLLGTSALAESLTEDEIRHVVQSNKLQNAANVLVIEAAGHYPRSEISAVLLQWATPEGQKKSAPRAPSHRHSDHPHKQRTPIADGQSESVYRQDLPPQSMRLVENAETAERARSPLAGIAAVLTLALLLLVTWYAINGRLDGANVNALSLRSLLDRVGATEAIVARLGLNRDVVAVGANSAMAANATPTLAPTPPRQPASGVDAPDDTDAVVAGADQVDETAVHTTIRSTASSATVTQTAAADPPTTTMATSSATVQATVRATNTLIPSGTATALATPMPGGMAAQTTAPTVIQVQLITPEAETTRAAAALDNTNIQKVPTAGPTILTPSPMPIPAGSVALALPPKPTTASPSPIATNPPTATFAPTVLPTATFAPSVTNGNVCADSVTNGNVCAGSVTNGNVCAGSVTNGNVCADSVTDGNVCAGSVTDGNVCADSVTNGNVCADSVTNGNGGSAARGNRCPNGDAEHNTIYYANDGRNGKHCLFRPATNTGRRQRRWPDRSVFMDVELHTSARPSV